MSQASRIEWTETTWNPIVGCSKVSPGCTNCYAIKEAHRLAGNPNPKVSSVYDGITVRNGKAPANWTGVVRLIEDRLHHPYTWVKGRMVFVNSMSDMFHESLDPVDIGRILNVIGNTERHIYQVLTKRADRMAEVMNAYYDTLGIEPYSNLWLGVSVENQEMADERIPHLLKIPAKIRFLSCEPLLGPINLTGNEEKRTWPWSEAILQGHGIDWVIAGGESGPNARPMHPEWARSLRDQCQSAGVPYFFKQWGKWVPSSHVHKDVPDTGHYMWPWLKGDDTTMVVNVGKKRAGHLLDGVEWRQFPEVSYA